MVKKKNKTKKATINQTNKQANKKSNNQSNKQTKPQQLRGLSGLGNEAQRVPSWPALLVASFLLGPFTVFFQPVRYQGACLMTSSHTDPHSFFPHSFDDNSFSPLDIVFFILYINYFPLLADISVVFIRKY